MVTENLICPICTDICEEPVESSCCHYLFCEDCVARQKSCPMCRAKCKFIDSLLAKRMIDQLPTECELCKYKCSRGDLAEHKQKSHSKGSIFMQNRFRSSSQTNLGVVKKHSESNIQINRNKRNEKDIKSRSYDTDSDYESVVPIKTIANVENRRYDSDSESEPVIPTKTTANIKNRTRDYDSDSDNDSTVLVRTKVNAKRDLDSELIKQKRSLSNFNSRSTMNFVPTKLKQHS